ncbi:MAG TPA: hypothetical protein VNJ29_02405 [Candidatus Nitrosotenuis sp.]|jgi:hypothetical protein|nr:hypothetical protein [Candidatus Nitrosotenuis sp.]
MTMGDVCRELGQYEEAHLLLEQHIVKYKNTSHQDLSLARGVIYLESFIKKKDYTTKHKMLSFKVLIFMSKLLPEIRLENLGQWLI